MSAAVTVNIKMYRVGELGDCFLLRFQSGSNQTHVLIDCGSFRNGAGSIARMKEVAADIKKQLGTSRLDIIAGTHQHNDHLSGFVHAQKTFEAMKPGQVWLSWLDDPTDNEATAIGTDFNNFLTELRRVNKQLHSFTDNPVKEKVNELLGFYGIGNGPERFNAKTEDLPAILPKQATEILQKLGSKKPKYLNPGEIFNLPGIPGGAVKVYVLGPPRNTTLLYDITPKSSETFDPHLASNGVQARHLRQALETLRGVKKTDLDEAEYPFAEPEFESDDFKWVWKSYYDKKNKWRTIDEDWLNQAERLALWLDDFTNNSSLVLAFEIVNSNKVLLFAADAQTGNWNSWKSVKWKKAPAGFNWLTLMNNTVLYKVGHHGSHNSTLVEGLNNMKHEELVALIPVEKTDGNLTKKTHPWKMPAEKLYKELKKRTQNRIIRMDDGPSRAEAWKKLPFKPTKSDLYCEYEVRG